LFPPQIKCGGPFFIPGRFEKHEVFVLVQGPKKGFLRKQLKKDLQGL